MKKFLVLNASTPVALEALMNSQEVTTNYDLVGPVQAGVDGRPCLDMDSTGMIYTATFQIKQFLDGKTVATEKAVLEATRERVTRQWRAIHNPGNEVE